MEAPLLQSRGTDHGRKEGNDDDNKKFDSSVLGDFGNESRTLWKIAGPAIFTSISQYSLGALTQTFTGFVGELELAAVSVENSVVAGLAFGVMLGMGSALETLCGQAYGAGQIRMLGIYMQRSWVILLTTACLLVPVYIWSPPILNFFGETSEISNAAGEFAIWMLPQLFAYALNFPIQKFLQAQSKVMVMAWISAVVLVLHTFFSWLLILKLGWGLVGAALVLNASWCIIVVAQLGYIFITGSDGAWNGFSWLAFSDLWGFVKLSLASAVMLCLEFWYLMVLVVITGRLPNPLIPVDAISICMNLNGWDAMIAIGFNAAISVRVSNELGAGNARAAKVSVVVVSATSVAIGVISHRLFQSPSLRNPELAGEIETVLVLWAAATLRISGGDGELERRKRRERMRLWRAATASTIEKDRSGIQEERRPLYRLQIRLFLPKDAKTFVLTCVAIGAGWQSLVAYINIGCYYIVGLPAGILLGFTFGFGVEVKRFSPPFRETDM
ncbi:unnamed protein product [Linum tenue]|uniref:Protein DETOXIFICATION n=1 Tax=Linum tenue TaxID=586396 RepID=A0AAV0P578_9ROSI|nr:unnamed protein product [Linum tenue]